MTVRQQMMDDLKAAMRSGDNEKRNAIRLVMAAIKQSEVDSGKTLDEEAIMAVLAKQAKQRRESIAEYAKSGRDELAASEQAELTVIEAYLPQQMSREEVETVVRSTIDELGISDKSGMGQLMGRLMGQLRGKADGKVVNDVVREMLGG